MSGVLHSFTLESTLPGTTVVVVATPADPPHRVVKISIVPKGKRPSKAYPPYRQQLHRYRIEEVLFGEAAAGTEIEVETTSGVTLEAHRLYHVEKISKILPYDQYESSLTDDDRKGDPRRILLLRRFGDGPWQFARDISEEPVRLREKIVSLLASRQAPDT